MAGRSASKSPAPPAVRRSSRQSTPTRELASPPPTTRSRSSGVGLPNSASTPAVSTLAVPTASSMPKSPSTRALSPRLAAKHQQHRPPLPTEKVNKLMDASKSPKLHKVKTQTLHLGDDNGTITIARVKCPVPKGVPGHIIKRFDTNAVSASSLFRAAFPGASAEDEAAEMRWIAVGSRGMYGDTAAAGVEHDETKKLSGTWIPAQYAHTLAAEYGITKFATDLIDFVEGARKGVETPEPAAAESDDSTTLRSPRSKRARVSSPLANKTSSSAQALSGATAPGVSILQTLSTAPESGIVTETTEVKLDVPAEGQPTSSNGLVASDEQVEAQLAAAKELVQSLKKAGTLAELTESTAIPESASSKKRALEIDEDEAALPTSGTLADLKATDDKVVDNRSFLSKLFRRKQRKVPTQAARETKALPSREVVVLDADAADQGEGRRWVAGLGLAVAVGATAAAPYLFG
ncbi:hypothetical protein JCM1840_005082 [Sporobolomyces johnsonii]